MDRKEFLKAGCGAGLCACAGISFLSQLAMADTAAPKDEKPAKEQPAAEIQWKEQWVKKVFTRLLETMEKEVDEPTRQKILISMGRECANHYGFPSKYKGNLEGFWNDGPRRYGETVDYDKEKGIITITPPEKDHCTCTCAFVDKEKTPPYFCDCTLGWQTELYETILSKPVKVELLESVLRGNKRCVVRIHILS